MQNSCGEPRNMPKAERIKHIEIPEREREALCREKMRGLVAESTDLRPGAADVAPCSSHTKEHKAS